MHRRLQRGTRHFLFRSQISTVSRGQFGKAKVKYTTALWLFYHELSFVFNCKLPGGKFLTFLCTGKRLAPGPSHPRCASLLQSPACSPSHLWCPAICCLPCHPLGALPSIGCHAIRWVPCHLLGAVPSVGCCAIYWVPCHLLGAVPSSGCCAICWVPCLQLGPRPFGVTSW